MGRRWRVPQPPPSWRGVFAPLGSTPIPAAEAIAHTRRTQVSIEPLTSGGRPGSSGASDRLAPYPDPGFDIWMATRSSTAADFGPPVLVPEVSTEGNNEDPTWISPDNCRLYFVRLQNGWQIYVAERAP